MIRFHVTDSARTFEPEIRYTLQLWAINQAQEIAFSPDADDAFTIGTSPGHHLIVAPRFTGPTSPSRNHPFVTADGNGTDDRNDPRVDPLASAFQMINSLQEYGATSLDELNRYEYNASYQQRMRATGDNLAQHCFDAISKRLGISIKHAPTRFFLSHDIDLVNSAVIEDGFHVIRKGRIDLFLRMLYNLAMGKPEWLNMDKIMKLESEYDCRSIFFWIVNKGRINRREENADYHFRARPIQKQFDAVAAEGFENGIHKSLNRESFREEFTKYGNVPYANRYHYLKFRLPDMWHDVEQAGLKLDASLGFSAEMGFRNSYGLPFNPYNFKDQKAFTFVEAPLHIMDRTFFQYRKQSPREARDAIFDFFSKNRTQCVLSILWHNNFFTNYKFSGYLDLYKQILAYIRDNNFRPVSAQEIIQQYSITR